ncbi:hypothetical protein [Streptomyces chryseus]|uniref:hypothetical protein n=1 Tax=Streptomyces chryseus TaxID=68186 RepID=UPI00110F8E09|nr:hypothetical protein [Streptomyces chryseus]GGX22156.1 hypothetical protein GCM10010353_41540 [Streptomyces chryseus]
MKADTLRAVEQCRYLTAARSEADLAWLAELPAQAGQQILQRLDRVYENFFNPQLTARFPAFEKRSHGLSVPLPGQAVEVRRTGRHWAQVRLPKLGWVSFRLSRTLGGAIRNATITRNGTGWHVIEARARRTGGSVTNSTRRRPSASSPATRAEADA